MDWIEDSGRKDFKIDKRFKRKIFSFFSFHLFESIRVIQYKETDSPEIIYTRAIGMNEKWIGIHYQSTSNKILSFINKKIYWLSISIFNKRCRVNVKESKFLKYKFIRDCFTDIKRNEILEKLGI
jgi:hypothetical protein